MKKIFGLFLTTLSFSLTAQAADFTISLVPVQHNHEVSEVTGLQSLLNDKASNASVSLKANQTAVDAALLLKADQSALTSGLAAKADSSTTTNALALKANQADLTSGLAGKVNTSALSSYVAKTDLKMPTMTKYTTGGATGTYSPPVGTLYIRVRMVGGGGGGTAGGTNTLSFVDASIGGTSNFAGSIAYGGGGATAPSGGVSHGGAGGPVVIAAGHIGSGFRGSDGAGGVYLASSGVYASGGTGGVSFFGGTGKTAQGNLPLDAAPNTGSGGSGGGFSSGGGISGGGGGAGGYVEVLIPASLLTAPVSYAVGNKGLGAPTQPGNVGNNGSSGGTGYIEITEYYQ